MAAMESSMSVASSGPRIASMMEGSSLLDGTSVEGAALEAAQSKSCFLRLSMLKS